MLRKFNYTGRKTIPRKLVTIALTGVPGDYAFSAQFDPAEFELPQNAKIFIEAYKRFNFKRFHFGTVGDVIEPEDLTLGGFPSDVLFRMKVVDAEAELGKILAMADQIRPLKPGNDTESSISLLWVDGEDLGQRLWKLDFSDEMPTLLVNDHVPEIKELVRSSAAFLSLVFPDVVGAVLREMFDTDSELDPWEDEDWPHLWARFGLKLTGADNLPSPEERADWIERVIDCYCNENRVRELFEREVGRN